jgi:hypothetical protein
MVVMLASAEHGTESNQERTKERTYGAAQSVSGDCRGGEKADASAEGRAAELRRTNPSSTAGDERARGGAE